MLVKREDFLGAWVDEELVCAGCLAAEESNTLKRDDVLLLSKIEEEDDLYFCDRCGQRIR